MDDATREKIRASVRIRIPGLKRTMGAGAVFRTVTEKLGMEPCSDCDKRKEWMDRAVRFEAWLEEEE